MSRPTLPASLAAAVLMILTLLPATASASGHEPFTAVNATGSRWSLAINGTSVDVLPEELRAIPDAFRIGGSSGRPYGPTTFSITPKGSTTTAAEVTVDVQERAERNYALVVHLDPKGQPQLSVWLDDVRPITSGTTRVEIRHVADGGSIDSELRPNGENPSTPSDTRSGTLPHNTGVRYNELIVNDYEHLTVRTGEPVPAPGSSNTATVGNLTSGYSDLELEGQISNVVYVVGQIVPARDLDDVDVDESKGLDAAVLAFGSREGAFQRSSFNDGFALRGYAGQQTTTGTPPVASGSPATGSTATQPIASSGPIGSTVDEPTPTDGGGSGGTLTDFTDVPAGSTFEKDIAFIADRGITKGCNPPANDRYCPDRSVTRAEMATFLRRALDLPDATTDYFDDDNDSVHEGDINAIAEAGITFGCAPRQFCPDEAIPREQMAAFLDRGYGFGPSTTDYFVDDEQSQFEQNINDIRSAEVTRGCNPPDNDRFCPDEFVTRAQMAAFIARAEKATA